MNNNNNEEPYIIPGFHFHPDDREVLIHYVSRRSNGEPLPWNGIKEFDVYGEAGPWELVTTEKKPVYVFSKLRKKTENSVKKKVRSCGWGTWKFQYSAPIYDYDGVTEIGVNSQLSFRPKEGNLPIGVEDGKWQMHEYSLHVPDNVDTVVVCKVTFKSSAKKNSRMKRKPDKIIPTVSKHLHNRVEEQSQPQPEAVSYPDCYNQEDVTSDQAGFLSCNRQMETAVATTGMKQEPIDNGVNSMNNNDIHVETATPWDVDDVLGLYASSCLLNNGYSSNIIGSNYNSNFYSNFDSAAYFSYYGGNIETSSVTSNGGGYMGSLDSAANGGYIQQQPPCPPAPICDGDIGIAVAPFINDGKTETSSAPGSSSNNVPLQKLYQTPDDDQ